MKIAIQGELGSFSHEAARAMVPSAKIVPCARSLEVFDRVKRGSVDGAVIPIENSLAGSVAEHFDLLLSRDVHIVREFRLRIVHNLIALPGTDLKNVHRVFSHPVALDQCRDLFARNPKLEPVPFYDTAGSVKHVVAEGLTDAAGIASRRAAEVYSGKILKAGIEDDKRNFTRFFLIRRGKAEGPRQARTRLRLLSARRIFQERCSSPLAFLRCATSVSARSSRGRCADVRGSTCFLWICCAETMTTRAMR